MNKDLHRRSTPEDLEKMKALLASVSLPPAAPGPSMGLEYEEARFDQGRQGIVARRTGEPGERHGARAAARWRAHRGYEKGYLAQQGADLFM